MKYLNNPKWNSLTIIVFTVVASVIMMTTDFVAKEAGMATLFLIWIPAFLGILTILLYFLSRLITKKYNWIISIAGILFTLATAIQYHYFS